MDRPVRRERTSSFSSLLASSYRPSDIAPSRSFAAATTSSKRRSRTYVARVSARALSPPVPAASPAIRVTGAAASRAAPTPAVAASSLAPAAAPASARAAATRAGPAGPVTAAGPAPCAPPAPPTAPPTRPGHRRGGRRRGRVRRPGAIAVDAGLPRHRRDRRLRQALRDPALGGEVLLAPALEPLRLVGRQPRVARVGRVGEPVLREPG